MFDAVYAVSYHGDGDAHRCRTDVLLSQLANQVEAYLVSGDYDYYIRIAVRDTRDYERLLREKLYKLPGIRHSKSHFVLRVLKETSEPLD